jgi:hypothetical protein
MAKKDPVQPASVLTPVQRAEMRINRDDMAKEPVNNPKITPRKPVELFKEGVEPPKDDEGPVIRRAKGGSIGSASKRADGCAQRGKTKGRMV